MKLKGLTSQQAQAKLAQNGPNEVVPSRLETRFEEIKRVLLDPMGLMLLALAGLHSIIGDQRDALILLAAYLPVTAVDVVLELRAQRALKAMRSSLKSTTKVLRDGIIRNIPVKEVVVEDILVFEEGQSLPADGKILESENLSVNESALTGESVPVEKSPQSVFFAGTTVLQGRGLGFVQTTGKETQFGRVATLLEETESQQTPLQQKVHYLIKRVLYVALILAFLLFFLELMRGESIYQSLIVAMTFGMSAAPEEFPLVFTLYLSLGAWRLSKHGVLIRSLPSVEALGNVDVICTDKTGTLTEGRFQLEQLYPVDMGFSADEMWQVALMACEVNAVDSMEVAIKTKGEEYLSQLTGWELVFDYPFEVQGKHMSHVWRHQISQEYLIAMKGAVEGVLEHCDLSIGKREEIQSIVNSFAGQGHRILGLASREGSCLGHRDLDEKGLKFIGLLLFSDPVRPSAIDAIRTCQNFDIEIKMLTGDHPFTAHAVADQTGITHSHKQIYTGHQLAEMTEAERFLAYQQGAIFSRVLPQQKHEMVMALKKSGKVVAMTGDGINDAPALKLADIGISMGLNATDVARSTAKMILVKNDFKGLVEAVFEGRKIFQNLRRSFSYLVAFHIPIILLALIPPVLGWGELLLPIHIVLLELIVHPISAFAFENLSLGVVTKEKSIMPKQRFWRSCFAGLTLSLVALGLFRWQENAGNLEVGRSWSMGAIFVGNIFFVLIETEFKINRRIFLTILSLITFGLMVFGISPLAELLHLSN